MKNSYWDGIDKINKTKIIGIGLAGVAVRKYRNGNHQPPGNAGLFGGLTCTFLYCPVVSLTVFAKYLPYSNRQGFVTKLVIKTGNIYNGSKIVGNSSTEITEFIFSHHSSEDFKDTMQMIYKLTIL